ncbi:uncharacterized protein LOC123223613 [Mangifera indica]|uniref:uncharacterized protein LOC123223613 n=1 Tax=Mangifera indica TaxID=29780 RepID=UPI001CFA696E|nr:uncharacterized protein LOC123223613 [Mangifera indica]
MAAAEARAVWQRTANRCFVQEDAKRAPKLACCQSSSSSTKQNDAGAPGVADAPDNPAIGFMPLNRNWSHSNLPDDTRWWLKLQPNCGYQKGLTCEQLNALEAKMEILRAGLVKPSSKVSGEHLSDERGVTHVYSNKSSEVPLDVHHGISAVCMMKDHKVRKQDIEALDCKTTQEFLELIDTRETYEFVEIDSVGYPTSKKSNESDFDPESPWIGDGKGEPWWRRTDKDDLASLVAQKSLCYMENCDLPPPQTMHIRRNPFACSPDIKKVEASSLDWKCKADLISNPIVREQSSSDAGGASVEKVQTPVVSDQSLRYSTTSRDIPEIHVVPESDSCKAQLMEALRHSQTRAREAEMAANQANSEKEHILKLFFRQASQLFAYKQWFQLLQLEALYTQIRNSDQPISTLFPVALPWTSNRGRKLRKSWQKAKGKRRKQNRPKNDTSKYAVAFALGLGLVGAGLLLGWTVGWMLF